MWIYWGPYPPPPPPPLYPCRFRRLHAHQPANAPTIRPPISQRDFSPFIDATIRRVLKKGENEKCLRKFQPRQACEDIRRGFEPHAGKVTVHGSGFDSKFNGNFFPARSLFPQRKDFTFARRQFYPHCVSVNFCAGLKRFASKYSN